MKLIKEILLTIIGCLFMALGISSFLLPNKISSGGFSGIATIFYYLFDIKMGTTIIILNIPLLIFAYFKFGKRFLLKTAIGTFFYSKSIDALENIFILTQDRLLSSIYGGILIGIGSAFVLKGNSSTGGSDLLAQIIKLIKPHYKTGNILVIVDIVIVILNIIFLKVLEIGLYSFIAIFISGKMIDIVFEGINFSKMIFIISEKSDDISKEIIEDYKRGATGFYAKGMYSKNNMTIIMCVAKRNDIMKIKELALKIDRKAFIIIQDAREVYGLGFK